MGLSPSHRLALHHFIHFSQHRSALEGICSIALWFDGEDIRFDFNTGTTCFFAFKPLSAPFSFGSFFACVGIVAIVHFSFSLLP
jgi:hypothetical protein